MTTNPELPPITVLMSCYNGETWLSESIESVLGQTFKQFEFLIIDDGSQDRSLSIIKEYEKKDPRIHVISKKNSGLPDSLNVGLQHAKGKWIARLDADDIAEPERLQKQYDFAKSNPRLILIGSAFLETDEHGNTGKVQTFSAGHRELKQHLLNRRRFFAHSSAFYLKEIALKAGGYRPRIKKSEDYDLWLRLSEMGKMASIREPLIRFRSHPDQISHENAGKRQLADGYVALTSYWIRKFNHPDPVSLEQEKFDEFREWVVSKIKEEEIFKFREFVENIKSGIGSGDYLRVMGLMMSKPKYVWRFMHSYFNEMAIWKKNAKKWIRLQDLQSNNRHAGPGNSDDVDNINER